MKRKYLIALLIAAAVLAIAFFAGDGVPKQNTEPINTPILQENSPTPPEAENAPTEISTVREEIKKEIQEEKKEEITPTEPQILEKTMCSLSVSCKTLLANKEKLSAEKTELVPSDGVILPKTSVVFTEGETVFDITKRVLKENGIHYEFSETPIYKSVYTEGIGNIYEFDCGELSGWMYCVNGIFPVSGCSEYILKDGDEVSWLYSCDMGADIGGGLKTDGEGKNE